MPQNALEPRSRAQANFDLLAGWARETDRRGVLVAWTEYFVDEQWRELGFASKAESDAAMFPAGWRMIMKPEERREVVADLTARGMATRAIGSALGVSNYTVSKDQESKGVRKLTPTSSAIREPDPPDPLAGFSADERGALAEFQATNRSLVVNMSTNAVLGPRLWAWAEANGVAERIDRRTRWGNPFEIPDDGNREQVIEKFANHYLPFKPTLRASLPELRGKILGCWCAPMPCHGHVLIVEAYR